MAECNKCKKKKNYETQIDTSVDKEKKSLFISALLLIVKTILFIIGSAILSIIVIPFSIYTLFKVIYSDGTINVTQNLLNIGKVLKGKSVDNDEIIEPNDNDEYELLEVDDITQEFSKK